MRDVVVGHRQDHQLRDRAGQAANTSRTLEQGCEVAVHVARIAAPPRNLLARRSQLAQGLGVARDVCEDDEHVEPPFEGEVLGDRQRGPRGQKPLDRGILGDVEEENRPLERRALREARTEEIRLTLGDAHGREDDDELAAGFAPGHGRLGCDLRREFCGRQAEAGEDRQLLSAHERVETVDRRDAGLDELVRVVAGDGVDRRAVDVAVRVGLHRRAAVDRATRPVQDASNQIDADGCPGDLAPRANARVRQVQAGCARQHLDDDPVPFDRQHLATPDLSAGRDHVDELVVTDALHAVREEQRPGHVRDGLVLDGQESGAVVRGHSSSSSVRMRSIRPRARMSASASGQARMRATSRSAAASSRASTGTPRATTASIASCAARTTRSIAYCLVSGQ